MPMPPALQKELVRQRTPGQYEGAPVKKKKVQRRRLFSWKQRLDRRTENVRESARAIKEGRAEAHPIILEHGFPGPINVPPEELQELGRTFGQSLHASQERRLRARPLRKKKPIGKKAPRMATPTGQDQFAAMFGQ